jgi:hypothetical protein
MKYLIITVMMALGASQTFGQDIIRYDAYELNAVFTEGDVVMSTISMGTNVAVLKDDLRSQYVIKFLDNDSKDAHLFFKKKESDVYILNDEEYVFTYDWVKRIISFKRIEELNGEQVEFKAYGIKVSH